MAITILTQNQMDVLGDIAKEIRNGLVDGGSAQEVEAQVAGVVESLRKAVEPQIVEIRKLKRGFRIMARHFLAYADLPTLHQRVIDKGDYERAAGDADCSICGLQYFEHPQIEAMPTFHVLCNHKIVKT